MNKANFRRVRPDGTVRFQGFEYKTDSLHDVAGKEVLVVEQNDFVSIALYGGWVEAMPGGKERVRSGDFICYARCSPMAGRWDDPTWSRRINGDS